MKREISIGMAQTIAEYAGDFASEKNAFAGCARWLARLPDNASKQRVMDKLEEWLHASGFVKEAEELPV